MPAVALAQTATPQTMQAVWHKKYVAMKGTVPTRGLSEASRCAGERRTPAASAGALTGFVVAALASYDVHVPGAGEYSLMDASSRTAGTSDLSGGFDDLKATCDLIARETGVTAFRTMPKLDPPTA